MKKIRRIVLPVLLLAAVLLCTCYFLCPRQMHSLITDTQPLTISVIQNEVTQSGISNTKSRVYDFAPGSAEYTAVTELLARYTYHNNLQSPFPQTSYSLGETQTTILVKSGTNCIQFTNQGAMSVGNDESDGDHIYSINYLNTKKAERLSTELQAILKQCTPSSET